MTGGGHFSAEVVVGVDVAKQAHWACAVSASGDELFSRAVSNEQAAIKELIDKSQAHGAVLMVVDTTSPEAALLLRVACCRNVPVAYIPGFKMRRAADTYEGRAKTDAKDAFHLADFARRNADRLNLVVPHDELVAQLQILSDLYVHLVERARETICRLRAHLTTLSLPLDHALGNKLANLPGAGWLLERWPTPSSLKAAGKSQIRKRIAERSPIACGKLAGAVWEALQAQTVADPVEEVRGQAIASLAADLNRTNQRRQELQKQIEALLMSHPLSEIITSMPGFGPLLGARALAEIGDPDRFATGDHLVSYAGLAPVVWQSGQMKSTRRFRTGNKRLKDTLYQAALRAKQHDPATRALYDKLIAKGRTHREAITTIARKRCRILLAILKSETLYHSPPPPNPHKLPTKPCPIPPPLPKTETPHPPPPPPIQTRCRQKISQPWDCRA